MDPRRKLLTGLYRHLRENAWREDWHWDHVMFVRACLVRFEQGQVSAWNEFVAYLARRDTLARTVRDCFEEIGYLPTDRLSASQAASVDDLTRVLDAAWWRFDVEVPCDERRTNKSRSEIMYIEAKPDLTGPARIGRVTFSKTRRTLYYRDQAFQSLARSGTRSCGYKRNYRDTVTNEDYWISRCRKDGQDTLYPGVVEIDDDVREEYWQLVRRMPEKASCRSYKSNGKYRR